MVLKSPDELENKKPLFKNDPEYLKSRSKHKQEHNLEVKIEQRMGKRLKSMSRLYSEQKGKITTKVRSISSHIGDKIEAKLKFVNGPRWCQKKANLMKEFILTHTTNPFSEAKASARFWEHYFELLRHSVIRKKDLLIKTFTKPKEGLGPWKNLWKNRESIIKERSPYAAFQSLRIRPMFVKSGDDLRQELLALSLIRVFQSMFDREMVKIYLRPYDVIIRNHNSGFIGTHA